VEHGSGDDQTCLVLDLMNYKLAITQTTDLAGKIFRGLSVFDNRTAQAIASSAHRTFSAKMARRHARGGLSGSSRQGVFEKNAGTSQQVASQAHKTQNKFNRGAQPSAYAGLSLFDASAVAAASGSGAGSGIGGGGSGIAGRPRGSSHTGSTREKRLSVSAADVNALSTAASAVAACQQAQPTHQRTRSSTSYDTTLSPSGSSIIITPASPAASMHLVPPLRPPSRSLQSSAGSGSGVGSPEGDVTPASLKSSTEDSQASQGKSCT
jgi:hypothetical protein